MKIPELKVRLYGDPCLRKKSVVVEEVGIVERMLVEGMIETMNRYKGIGLAAPQVGINQRIIVADIGDGPIAVINPEIIKEAGAAVLEEGCLSIPEVNINVTRSQTILVRFTDLDNKVVEKKFKDLMARVIQHETDHLDGKLIVDYATDEEAEKYAAVLKKLETTTKGQA